MSGTSRRNFLRTASVGAAAVGAASAVPFALAAPANAAETESNAPAHDGPLVAWVKNAKTGEIAVLVGEHEVLHHDKKLARRLAQIAATAPRA